MEKMKNILVTGGSGFMGSHMADLLTLKGHNVVIFDRVKSPYLKDNQKMIIGDLLNFDDIDKALDGIDCVFHYGAIAGIEECLNNPISTVEINILATIKLLEACVKHDIKRFMFASTSYVYSNAGFFYRSSKQACENFIENYSQLHNLKYTILRYGSLYGTRAGNSNSIYKLIRQALVDKKITYHGTGDELREFVHVLDAAEISYSCLSDEFENSQVIISGHEKYRYRDLLEMIKEIFSNKIEIEMLESHNKAHYKITSYNFNPKLGKKITKNSIIDLGQGLLDLIEDIHNKELV